MFLPDMNQTRLIPPAGDPNSRIGIVGDFSSAFDLRAMKPFSGPSGTVLEQCLHAAGLIRGECYITNLFKTPAKKIRKDGNEFVTIKPGKVTFSEIGLDHVNSLLEELDNTQCNVIIAAGAASFAALCNLSHLSRYRGYIFSTYDLKEPRKVIPTHHPSDSIRGMYTYRHMMVADLKKAKHESAFRELIRPDRKLIYNFDSIEEVLQWLDYYNDQPTISVDIEVLNYEISCISFSSNPNIAISIPISDRWELDEELLLWRALQKVLGNPKSEKVLQNGIFDIQFILSRNGLVLRGPIRDTMIAHSIMFPELPKGLGFLGSIYCGSQAYWKDSVKFTNIKEES